MNSFFSAVARLLKVFYDKAVRLPIAQIYARKLFCDNTMAYIVICDHIGDFLITMGYLEAFKRRHGFNHVTVFTTPKMKNLAERYLSPGDQIICFTRNKLDLLLYLETSDLASRRLEQKGNIWLIDPGVHFKAADMRRLPGITLHQVIKHCCLQLTEDASYTPLPLPGCSSDVNRDKRNIIFCPYTQRNIGSFNYAYIFEALLASLSQQDMLQLYLNIGPEDSDLTFPGVKPLRLSLTELENWISHNTIIIGYRSGLLDFLAYHDCHIVCLYSPDQVPNSKYWPLSMLPEIRCNYVDILLSEDADRDINKVMAAIKPMLALD